MAFLFPLGSPGMLMLFVSMSFSLSVRGRTCRDFKLVW